MTTKNGVPFLANGLITITSDFGRSDPYVAAMKGVIRSVQPTLRVDELSQEIPPQDIRRGARFLVQACPYYPAGTVHLAVVDPGVGTERRGLLAVADGQAYVGPDNGLFQEVLRSASLHQIWTLSNRALFAERISDTFHGRDCFAPVAAMLAAGLIGPGTVGDPLSDPVQLAVPAPQCAPGQVSGQIIDRDHFGNLLTNISATMLPLTRPTGASPLLSIRTEGHTFSGICRIYVEVPQGAPLALIGSYGMLELAVRDGSMAAYLGIVEFPVPITVTWSEP